MKPSFLQPAAVFVFALLAASAQAGDWPQWRGPFFNGSTDERGLPSKWSKTENIAWVADLPGPAASTPVVCGNRVFLSGVDATNNSLQVMCFDRASGKRMWSHDVAQGISRDHRSNYANASPVTDGTLVVFLFGNGDLVCFDLSGVRRWSRNIERDFGPFAFYWTFGGSPLLFDGRLYLQVLQRDVPVQGRGRSDRENESFLLALDPRTGKTLWRHVRPSQAVGESRESHTTPIPMVYKGQPQLVIAGGDALSGHDPATGKEIWRWGSWNPQRNRSWPLIASSVAADGVALVCVPKGQPVYAIRVDQTGTLDERGVAWNTHDARTVTSEVPTPAYYDGDFFVLSDSRKTLSRLDPHTGAVKWNIRTPGKAKYEASPLAADGKIYLINFDGQVAVIRAQDGQLINEIPMDEPADGGMVRSSIIASHGQLFIRTTRRLYCIGTNSTDATGLRGRNTK
ncbi:MAG: PQQ-like beta-propeller repeat protein [Verrucomicrobia bacterium]|nr:PQQ-like beta-propeller repeat protein [Verrucomicrobiota bacterium]